MNKKINLSFVGVFVFLIALNMISAANVYIDSVTMDKLYPGQTSNLRVDIFNGLENDVEDVILKLNLENTQFTTSGSAEDSEEEIRDDDYEGFSFIIKAPNDIKPGDYNIPYSLTYIIDESNKTIETKTGSFGISVSAKTELDFSAETTEAIVGQQGKISLKIINKGLGEVKFITVEIYPQGYELISSDKVYIGTIDSDDSDFASFDVVYKNTNPTLSARITYKDFDNKDQVETITLPVKVYSREEAINLGLISKPNYTLYIVIVVLIIIWFVWRKIRKRKKQRR